ncbi:MAG: hypothetical protein ACTSUE_08150 [Promethearchaeota archaeon]
MPKSDRICYIDTGDKPFYKFQYGREFPRFLASMAGLISGAGAFLMTIPFATSGGAAFLVVLIAGNGGALLFGMLVTSSLFFFYMRRIIETALFSVCLFNLYFIGLFLVTGYGSIGGVPDVGVAVVILGIIVGAAMIVLGTLVVSVLFARHGKVGIFTDGVKIGKRSFKYEDVIAISHGTGPVEKSIPREGMGKELIVLTPIEYEYVGKDFGIYHVYMYLVTADAVYVAQSLNRQSNMAQDALNAWVRHGAWNQDARDPPPPSS